MAMAPHPSLISNNCRRRRRDERLLASTVGGRQGTVPGADQEQRQPARRGGASGLRRGIMTEVRHLYRAGDGLGPDFPPLPHKPH